MKNDRFAFDFCVACDEWFGIKGVKRVCRVNMRTIDDEQAAQMLVKSPEYS